MSSPRTCSAVLDDLLPARRLQGPSTNHSSETVNTLHESSLCLIIIPMIHMIEDPRFTEGEEKKMKYPNSDVERTTATTAPVHPHLRVPTDRVRPWSPAFFFFIDTGTVYFVPTYSSYPFSGHAKKRNNHGAPLGASLTGPLVRHCAFCGLWSAGTGIMMKSSMWSMSQSAT